MDLAIVTGASSGIGAATAKLFLEKGWKVLAMGRDTQRLEELKRTAPAQLHTLTMDFENLEGTLPTFQKTVAELTTHYPLRALCHVAGAYKYETFIKTTPQNWKALFQVNLFAVAELTALCWPHLKAAQGASVVHVSSTLGLRPVENTAAYSASKAALNSLSDTLALEGAPQQIRSHVVCPGVVETPIHGFFNKNDESALKAKEFMSGLHPLGRMGTPDDVASVIYFLSDPAQTWMTGTVIKVDGGIHLTSKG